MRRPHTRRRFQNGGARFRTIASSIARRPRRAFTLVELLVSIGLLALVIVTVSQIFKISSDAAARAAANADVIAASGALRETLSDQIRKMAPYVLVIDCPAPTTARQETPGGPRFLRIRHDRLVFLTQGDVDEYQSFTDPARGDPVQFTTGPTSSSEALVYFGPGIPLSKKTSPPRAQILDDDSDPLSVTLTASEWVFLHRSILLAMDPASTPDASWTPPTLDQLASPGGMLNDTSGMLETSFLEGRMDVVYSPPGSTYLANAWTVGQLILRQSLTDDPANPSIAALWHPSLAPRTASLSAGNTDFYNRSGSNFIPHLADFRIEWTDGRRIDPLGPDLDPTTPDGDPRTRWFGLRPDPDFNVTGSFLSDVHNISNSSSQLPYVARRRQDVIDYGNGLYADSTQSEIDVFQNKIEWSNVAGPDPNAHYRAIWRADTWEHRPKALRFTYRVYDEGNRLKNATEVDLDEDGDVDPDGPGSPTIVSRFGRQFSIVVAVP